MSLLTVLTVRSNSRRFKNKCLEIIDGKPFVLWIIERLNKLPGKLVLATSTLNSDDKLCEVVYPYMDVFRGSINNVVKRIDDARIEYAPDAKFVLRALGDCPFLDVGLVTHAYNALKENDKDAFVWATTPDNWSVYGSREFPYSVKAWKKIVENASGDELEHVDLYFHRNRDEFDILYHEPLPNIYFRDYRLEFDYVEDYLMINSVAKEIGMDADLKDVIKLLDTTDIHEINRKKVEITGPTTSYSYEQRRKWLYQMQGKHILLWKGHWLIAPSDKSTPILCKSGKCLLGYALDGVLYRKNTGDIIRGDALIKCNCKSDLIWNYAKKRTKSY